MGLKKIFWPYFPLGESETTGGSKLLAAWNQVCKQKLNGGMGSFVSQSRMKLLCSNSFINSTTSSISPWSNLSGTTVNQHGQAPPISLLCLEIQMHFQTEGFCMASSQQQPKHQGLQSHDQHGVIAFTKPFFIEHLGKKWNTKVSQQCHP
jgi:hypothetical protein